MGIYLDFTDRRAMARLGHAASDLGFREVAGAAWGSLNWSGDYGAVAALYERLRRLPADQRDRLLAAARFEGRRAA